MTTSEQKNTDGHKRGAGIAPYIHIARPDHWIKQLFILPGVVLGLLVGNVNMPLPPATRQIVLVLLATSLIASANYVINEWLDRDFDRFHPVKKHRPAVAQGLNPVVVYAEWATLSVLGMGTAWLVNVPCFVVVATLWVMGLLYNVKPIRTKDIPYLDVLSESLNNALRLLIGWFAIVVGTLPPTSAVIGYWMAGAYLMAIKRFSEYRAIGDPKTAGLYRKSFARYTERSLLDSSLFYAMFSVFLLGVFLVKWHIEYVIAMPFLCGLYVMYFNLAFQKDSAVQAPEKLYHERRLMLYVVFLIVLFAVLTVVSIPVLHTLSDVALIRM
ncbi:MAG: UbiA prenyltransferase family protein [Coriobacteriales bacterium]|nr:UbiA prenyltransferase family protein [Coriobacteriales bacterium]